MQHFSDRLAKAIRARRSVVCVGLDPALERMPPALVEKYRPQAAELGEDEAVAACFQEFCSGVIDAVAGFAACVKPQARLLRAVWIRRLARPGRASRRIHTARRRRPG